MAKSFSLPNSIELDPPPQSGSPVEMDVWRAQQEFRIRAAEYAVRRHEAERPWYQNPLVVAIIVGSLSLVGNLLVALYNSVSNISLEDRKAEGSRVLGALEAEDPDQAAKNLQLLIDARLITGPLKDGITDYIANRSSGEGAVIGRSGGLTGDSAMSQFLDADYSNRLGYDEMFVGALVRLPSVSEAISLVGGEVVINYHHFSLALHKARKLPIYTAANVDFRPESKAPEPGLDYSRSALLGLRRYTVERLLMDPRVPQNAQLLEDFYSKDKGAFDKGNIVARSSVAWGTTYEELRRANVDSYHATNFSPQTASFNQRGAWAQLEERVQELGRRTPLVVFAGPVLSAEDPIFVGQENENPAGVQIPRQFWKIVVDFELGRLRASAFILRQDLSGVNVQPASMEPEGAWRISVSELEAILGIVSFPAEIHNADVALSSQESSYELTADLERYR